MAKSSYRVKRWRKAVTDIRNYVVYLTSLPVKPEPPPSPPDEDE